MADETPSTPITQKRSSRLLRFLATAATGALAVGLVASGSNILSSRAANIRIEQAAPTVMVAARPIRFEPGYDIPHRFVGQVEPLQTTDLAFEFGGTVHSVHVDEGHPVHMGDVVAHLDVRSLENQKATRLAARRALEAQVRLSELTLERQQALQEKGFAATQTFDQVRLGLAELEARIAEIDAAIAGIDIQIDKSVIRAPFDAQVGSRSVDDGASVRGGQAVVTLFQRAEPRMRVGLAPAVANRLSPGDEVTAEIAGRSYRARLTGFRPDLDPTTRTRTALFAIDTGPGEAATDLRPVGRPAPAKPHRPAGCLGSDRRIARRRAGPLDRPDGRAG